MLSLFVALLLAGSDDEVKESDFTAMHPAAGQLRQLSGSGSDDELKALLQAGGPPTAEQVRALVDATLPQVAKVVV